MHTPRGDSHRFNKPFKEFYMKNVNKRFGFVVIAAIIGLSFAAPVHAGGIVDRVFSGGAKDLAKQTQTLTKQAAELEKKAADIEEKAAALSARDRRTYQEELTRLGVEAPEGLFSDAASLFSGAGNTNVVGDDTDDTAGSGILGGLIGLARSLGGGNNNSGAASGGTAAPSGGSSSSPTAPAAAGSGNANAAGNTTAVPGGGRTAAFFNMFDSGTYHMKAKSTFGGMEVIVETFMKGDMTATVSEASGMTTRTIQRDNMAYVIMDATRTVMVYPVTASSGNPSEEPVRTAGMIMTGSGTARFDGRNLPYEEYSLSSGGAKIQWFLDGNNLAGLRTITSEMTIYMVILALDQNVPNSVFEIPSGYQRMEMPRMPGGN
jgi:hypothetical protein